MRAVGYVVVLIALVMLITLVTALVAMWVGNSFLTDAGLDRVEYWNWYWFILVFTTLFASGNRKK